MTQKRSLPLANPQAHPQKIVFRFFLAFLASWRFNDPWFPWLKIAGTGKQARRLTSQFRGFFIFISNIIKG
jgi:hypothetical protein